MIAGPHPTPMRLLLALLLLVPALLAQDDLPADVAAVHPEGKWKIRKAEFYRYLVDYYGKQPVARMARNVFSTSCSMADHWKAALR